HPPSTPPPPPLPLHAALPIFRTSTIRPATAAAAAIGGLIKWVRPPRPWRPSKLRFDVEAQRSPLCSTSGFIPRHIEHPALRHSRSEERRVGKECRLWGSGTAM